MQVGIWNLVPIQLSTDLWQNNAVISSFPSSKRFNERGRGREEKLKTVSALCLLPGKLTENYQLWNFLRAVPNRPLKVIW
jgi:hypothetical protein